MSLWQAPFTLYCYRNEFPGKLVVHDERQYSRKCDAMRRFNKVTTLQSRHGVKNCENYILDADGDTVASSRNGVVLTRY